MKTMTPATPTPTNSIIIGCVGGGLLFLAITAAIVFCLFKSRGNDADNTGRVDENPVYMDDYADPDSDNEVYDRNAYYAAGDMEEVAEVSTVARDLNPDYETCL